MTRTPSAEAVRQSESESRAPAATQEPSSLLVPFLFLGPPPEPPVDALQAAYDSARAKASPRLLWTARTYLPDIQRLHPTLDHREAFLLSMAQAPFRLVPLGWSHLTSRQRRTRLNQGDTPALIESLLMVELAEEVLAQYSRRRG